MVQPHKMLVLVQKQIPLTPDGDETLTGVSCSCSNYRGEFTAASYAEGIRAAKRAHGTHVELAGGNDVFGVVAAMQKTREQADA